MGQPSANQRDISYWGGVPQAPGTANLGGYPEENPLLNFYGSQKSALRDLAESEKRIMRAQEMDAISGAQPGIGSLRDTLEPVVNQALDTINPIPISAAGTIIGPKAARDWSEELVGKAKKAWESGKYTTKSGDKSKVALTQDHGYYPSRGKGDWRTQIDDDTATIKKPFVDNLRSYLNSKKKTGEDISLSDVWKHTNLYANYPTIATRTRVKFTRLPGLALGQVDTKLDKAGDLLESVIEIDPHNVQRYAKREGISLADMYHQIFTHEGQHIVQAIEGMPSGSNPGYFTRMKDPNSMEPDSYRMLKALLKKMPPDAPRAKQIKEHIDFLDRVKDVPDGVLYRHTLGEADAGWAEKMHKVKNVKYQTPLHEREVGKQWWGGKQEPYNPEWSALTSKEDSIMGSVKSHSEPVDFSKFKEKKEMDLYYKELRDGINSRGKQISERTKKFFMDNPEEPVYPVNSRYITPSGNKVTVIGSPSIIMKAKQPSYRVKIEMKDGSDYESSMLQESFKQFRKFTGPTR